MLIGIINGSNIRIGHYKQIFPYVSFPTSGPDNAFLAANNAKKVSLFKPHDRATEKLVAASPHVEGDFIYTVSVASKSAEEIENEVQAISFSKTLQNITERDRILAACDWTQLSDSPLSNEKKAEWATYRQALRDLPEDEEWPDITFPNDPNYVSP